MSNRRPRLNISRDPNKCAIIYSLVDGDFVTSSKESKIPQPYASTSSVIQCLCSSIDPSKIFRRAGIIPFTMTSKGPIIFLTLFNGKDRGTPVIELSDFGGTVEKDENFVRTACHETAEESLGLFNFTGKENIIRQNSFVSYTEDCSVIIMATPITISCKPIDISLIYTKLKEKINGPLEVEGTLPRKNFVSREIMTFSPKICQLIEWSEVKQSLLPSDDNERDILFNANETANIVYITLEDIKIMLKGEPCPMPKDLYSVTGSRYTNYPPLYFVVAKHLVHLVKNIEDYYL
jgi:hypothetical protein